MSTSPHDAMKGAQRIVRGALPLLVLRCLPSLHYFFDPYWRNTLATGLTWFRVAGETIWQIPLEDTIVLTLLPGRRVVPFLLTGPGLYDTLLPEENDLGLGLHAGGGVFLRLGGGGLSLRVRYLRYDVTDSDAGALEYGLALGARF